MSTCRPLPQASQSPSDLDNFDYELPPSLIASRPAKSRDGARLLDLCQKSPNILPFRGLPDLLQPGDLAVFNNSRVIPARLLGTKESGGKVEIFAERFISPSEVLAQVRASKPPKIGMKLLAGGIFSVCARDGEFWRLRAENRTGKPVLVRRRFMRRGQTPLPPYIHRAPDAEDKYRYQTVYARVSGSVAAPTAGLHFTPAVLTQLKQRGVETANITLHIGAGTFLPLRQGLSSSLHPEKYRISRSTVTAIRSAKQRGKRVVAIGTTTLRALESAVDKHGKLQDGDAETRLFIKPGHRFAVADMLLTNFHLPQSSLLVLACAFGGTDKVLRACRFAVDNHFRFYSYGDAMLLPCAAPSGKIKDTIGATIR